MSIALTDLDTVLREHFTQDTASDILRAIKPDMEQRGLLTPEPPQFTSWSFHSLIEFAYNNVRHLSIYTVADENQRVYASARGQVLYPDAKSHADPYDFVVKPSVLPDHPDFWHAVCQAIWDARTLRNLPIYYGETG